ncbi:ferritin [Candidatus Falkowbacteria bacterium CG10_big_fil_rev_8_21_14_0_10_37_18]|uniref:Ferritin n=1 Tax=Candidatus Falkowbacteria bacterium CG10_big_fil_rev_8_21_14_0_10_37_18 TaxID=1974562 RepID=A0A2H0VB89_9BACT|nr:MAG: ferritin [Candidatus Falkowbacteria bacterium CG10_big_fil_rev_8_21_14_0_10_37_18]
MTAKIKKILNEQIREEFYSSYLYLAFSGYLNNNNLKGAANWMHIQAQEEVDHAIGLFRFLLDREEEPELQVIDKPKMEDIKDIEAVFAASLKHERHISECINKIYEAAREEKDYALESFIKWYIDEQVEEEANAMDIIGKLKMVGADKASLYLLDQELAARVYVPSGPYAAKK